jgi:hypothetical protein
MKKLFDVVMFDVVMMEKLKNGGNCNKGKGDS